MQMGLTVQIQAGGASDRAERVVHGRTRSVGDGDQVLSPLSYPTFTLAELTSASNDNARYRIHFSALSTAVTLPPFTGILPFLYT